MRCLLYTSIHTEHLHLLSLFIGIFCHHKLAPPDTIIIPWIQHKFADKQVDTSCIFLIEEVDNIQYVDILIIEKPGLFAQDFVYSLTDVNTSVL